MARLQAVVSAVEMIGRNFLLGRSYSGGKCNSQESSHCNSDPHDFHSNSFRWF
jgi:hypothetical protein